MPKPSSSAVPGSMSVCCARRRRGAPCSALGLAALAAALHLAAPLAFDPLSCSALGPFVAVAALLGRRAGGLGAVIAAVVLTLAFGGANANAIDLTLFAAKWLAVVVVAGFVHDLWLGAAERDRLRADELARERQRLALALEAGAIGVSEMDFRSGVTATSDKWRRSGASARRRR